MDGKENQEDHTGGIGGQTEKGDTTIPRTPTLGWDAFISILKDNCNNAYEVDAFVMEQERILLTPVMSCHERAAVISKAVWDATGYRFKCVNPPAWLRVLTRCLL